MSAMNQGTAQGALCVAICEHRVQRAPGLMAAAAPLGGCPRGTGTCPPGGAGVVMSWMLDRRLSFFFALFMRMKYFCAWLATCIGQDTI